MKTRLAEIMNARGIERKEMAKALDIERRTFDNYYNDKTQMTSDTIRKVANYLNVSTDYLLGVDQLDNKYLNDKIDAICAELKELIYHLNQRK